MSALASSMICRGTVHGLSSSTSTVHSDFLFKRVSPVHVMNAHKGERNTNELRTRNKLMPIAFDMHVVCV